MNIEELNKSIQELESQLAAYSTPKNQQSSVASTGRSARDTGYDSAAESTLRRDMLTPILTQEIGAARAPWSPLDSTDSVRKKSVKFENTPAREKRVQTPEDETYSLSKCLVKDGEASSSLQSDEKEPCQKEQIKLQDVESNITYRKRDKDVQATKSENEPADKSKEQAEYVYHKPPVLVKPAAYDGITSWQDYKSHFEACAALGKWSEADKALYLAVSLRGQAQAVLGDMTGTAPRTYEELITALTERFAPPNQMELYRAQLRERRQRASDTLPELGQSIRRLTNLAYPTPSFGVREIVSKEYFIDALVDSDIRLRIKQARPSTLNDAIRHY